MAMVERPTRLPEQVDDSALRLFARLHRQVRPLRRGGPTPAPAPTPDLDRDVAVWRALGRGARKLLEVVACSGPPFHAASLAPNAPHAWRIRRGRHRGSGPLRLDRRVAQAHSVPMSAGALVVLAALGARSPRRLVPVLDRRPGPGAESDWYAAVYHYFAAAGRRGQALLTAVLIDRTRPVHTRCLAAAALRAVAEARPLLRSDSVSGLCWVLGPRYTRTVADEDVAAAAVGELQNLGAAEALPRIEAAYARDAVTPTVTSLADVYAALAPDADPPVAAPPAERSLPLSCMVCGRTRRHEVHGYAIGANLVGGPAVAELDPAERKLHERYRALAIAHPVRCPHCRAVNRYRVGAWTLVEVTAHLGEGADGAGGSAVGHPPWVMADFAGSVGRVHPAVTAHRLRSRLRANPADHACRVRCANALRMCGRWAEAEAAYRRVAAAPRASGAARQEAEFNLALLAAAADRRKEAAQWCRLALGEVPTDRLPALTSALPVGAPVSGREETMLRPMLAKLHDPGAFEAREWYDDLAVPWRGLLAAQYFVAQPAARGRKVGRNEPCPCGSGRKYKRCCGA